MTRISLLINLVICPATGRIDANGAQNTNVSQVAEWIQAAKVELLLLLYLMDVDHSPGSFLIAFKSKCDEIHKCIADTHPEIFAVVMETSQSILG